MNLTNIYLIIRKYYLIIIAIIIFILIIALSFSLLSSKSPNKNIPQSLDISNPANFSLSEIDYNSSKFDVHYVPTNPSKGKLSAGKLYVTLNVSASDFSSPNLKNIENEYLHDAKEYLMSRGINPSENVVYTFD